MADRETALAAAVTLDLFPESIREELIAERSFLKQFGLPISTTVTFLPDGNKFVVEDLYDCAHSVFDGAESVEFKCLSPLKLCHYLSGIGGMGDGSEAVFG